MKYLSVCSGIEAATVAWHGLDWTPVGFSEIEPFPSAVLQYRYPSVPNLGDMTNYKEWQIERPDLLVGGTPCQSFSVAGLRKGLDDPRGNLALIYCGILDYFRPQWFVWENVPGVLSSGGDGTLVPSSGRWLNSGMGSPTECLTLNGSEWPSAAAVCSLSDILETGDLPQRFFLSTKACAGILRRAEKRGKQLPPQLSAALRSVAQETSE
jgi:site-specific DNA-cytosine methylase